MYRDHEHPHSRIQAFLAAALACAIGLVVLVWHDQLVLSPESTAAHLSFPYPVADSDQYIAIAEGRMENVESPFSKRVLFPWIAGELAQVAHLPLSTSFLYLNAGFFVLLVFSLAASLRKLGANPWFLVLCFLTPLPLEGLETAYLPDLCHMALLALFFLLLLYNFEYAALAMLLAAFLARENTLLLCLATGILSWKAGRKTLALGCLIVLGAGMVGGGVVSRGGSPNPHHWPDWLFMAVRVPHDFLANVLGIVLETNVHQVHPAQWKWAIPPHWQIGLDREVYLTLYWPQPCRTLLVLLSLFGCAPVIARWAWKRVAPLADWNLTMRIAFCYGLVSYLLGTSLGATTHRLIGYGWPLYWLWLPAALSWIKPALPARRTALLVACSLIAAWFPHWEGVRNLAPRYTLWLLLVPLLHAATWVLLTKPNCAVKSATVPTNGSAQELPQRT